MRININNAVLLKGSKISLSGSHVDLFLQLNEEDFFDMLDGVKLSNIHKYLKIRRNETIHCKCKK